MYFHFVVVHTHVQSCFFLPVKTYWFIAVLVAIAVVVKLPSVQGMQNADITHGDYGT